MDKNYYRPSINFKDGVSYVNQRLRVMKPKMPR